MNAEVRLSVSREVRTLPWAPWVNLAWAMVTPKAVRVGTSPRDRARRASEARSLSSVSRAVRARGRSLGARGVGKGRCLVRSAEGVVLFPHGYRGSLGPFRLEGRVPRRPESGPLSYGSTRFRDVFTGLGVGNG